MPSSWFRFIDVKPPPFPERLGNSFGAWSLEQGVESVIPQLLLPLTHPVAHEHALSIFFSLEDAEPDHLINVCWVHVAVDLVVALFLLSKRVQTFTRKVVRIELADVLNGGSGRDLCLRARTVANGLGAPSVACWLRP